MGKLIAKTAAITFGGIIAAALILFGIFSLFFPSVMVSLTDKLGMEGACASYSVAQYEKSGDIEDLALAVERSYYAEHFKDAADLGDKLIQSKDFLNFCNAKDVQTGASQELTLGSSAQYYNGLTAAAQYYVKSDRALDTAFGAIGKEFSENNAVVFLTSVAMREEDKEFCRMILDRLDSISASNQEELIKFKEGLRSYCQ